jgi:hypothetical protein
MIGYGHTGPEVSPGLTISQAQADAWLEADVAKATAAVNRLLAPVALSPTQRDALVSFCFNVGAGAWRARPCAGDCWPANRRSESSRLNCRAGARGPMVRSRGSSAGAPQRWSTPEQGSPVPHHHQPRPRLPTS